MRLSLIAPAALSDQQKPLYEEMKAGVAAKYSNFTTPIWESALAAFGKEGAREIVYLVGHHCLFP